MNMVTVPICRKPGMDDLPLPQYMSPHAAGMDIPAALDDPMELRPGAIALVPAGFSIAVPPGYEAQVRPRSGLALKHGITVANAPGTIDADYRGEVGVILCNISRRPYTIRRGERIAQMVIAPVVQAEWRVSETLEDTERGAGGFGHTGT